MCDYAVQHSSELAGNLAGRVGPGNLHYKQVPRWY